MGLFKFLNEKVNLPSKQGDMILPPPPSFSLPHTKNTIWIGVNSKLSVCVWHILRYKLIPKNFLSFNTRRLKLLRS